MFQTELKEFYIKCLKEEQVDDQDIVVENSDDEIFVIGKNGKKEIKL